MSTVSVSRRYQETGEPIADARFLSGVDIARVDEALKPNPPVHKQTVTACKKKCPNQKCGMTSSAKRIVRGVEISLRCALDDDRQDDRQENHCQMYSGTNMDLLNIRRALETAYADGAKAIDDGSDPQDAVDNTLGDPTIGDHPAPPRMHL